MCCLCANVRMPLSLYIIFFGCNLVTVNGLLSDFAIFLFIFYLYKMQIKYYTFLEFYNYMYFCKYDLFNGFVNDAHTISKFSVHVDLHFV